MKTFRKLSQQIGILESFDNIRIIPNLGDSDNFEHIHDILDDSGKQFATFSLNSWTKPINNPKVEDAKHLNAIITSNNLYHNYDGLKRFPRNEDGWGVGDRIPAGTKTVLKIGKYIANKYPNAQELHMNRVTGSKKHDVSIKLDRFRKNIQEEEYLYENINNITFKKKSPEFNNSFHHELFDDYTIHDDKKRKVAELNLWSSFRNLFQRQPITDTKHISCAIASSDNHPDNTHKVSGEDSSGTRIPIGPKLVMKIGKHIAQTYPKATHLHMKRVTGIKPGHEVTISLDRFRK